MCGRLGDAEPPGDVGDAQLTIDGEALEHVEGAADRLQAGTGGGPFPGPASAWWRTTSCSCAAIDMSGSFARSVCVVMTVPCAAWFDQRMRSTERNTPPVTLLARAAM